MLIARFWVVLGCILHIDSYIIATDTRVIKDKNEISDYITKLEDYLNSIKTFVSEFVQYDRYGNESKGYFFLKRPGKMKLSYLPPAMDVIVAKDRKITHYNRELKEKTITSMHSSPLSFFLEHKINLRDNVRVIFAEESGDTISILFCKKDDNAEGAVALTFKKKPLELLRWEIFADKSNVHMQSSTKVILLDSQINEKKISDNEFDKLS